MSFESLLTSDSRDIIKSETCERLLSRGFEAHLLFPKTKQI